MSGLNLDKKDCKLLYYLSKNSRKSHTQLAKYLSVAKNTVKYRIERLEKLGVIKNFACVVNLASLGYLTYVVLIKFNEDIYGENNQILNYFKNHKIINWAVTLSGEWDVLVEIPLRNFHELSRVLNSFKKNFGKKLNSYIVLNSYEILRIQHLIEDFYENLELEKIPQKKRTSKKYEIDGVDKKILSELNKNSNLPYLKIAQKTSLTIDVIKYRIKKLYEKNILVKCFSEIDNKLLGYTEYFCKVKFKNESLEELNQSKLFISNHPNVTYAFYDVLTNTVCFCCAFKDSEGIDHIMRYFRRKFSSNIHRQEYLIIKEQLVFNLYPEGLVTNTP